MFDPISLIPTEALRAFRDRIHLVAREKIGPQASRVDEKEFINREAESLLWDHGLLTLTFPKKYGGYGKGRAVALCIGVEEIAKY